MSAIVETTSANVMPTVSIFPVATAASARQASNCLPAGPVWVSPACLTGLTEGSYLKIPRRRTDRLIVWVLGGKCRRPSTLQIK